MKHFGPSEARDDVHRDKIIVLDQGLLQSGITRDGVDVM
jgi:hypothetical protein